MKLLKEQSWLDVEVMRSAWTRWEGYAACMRKKNIWKRI
jgi:hypothetical protein